MNFQQFHALCNVLPEPMLLVAAGGEILASNRAADHLLQHSADSIRGRRFHEFVRQGSETLPQYLRHCSRCRDFLPGRYAVGADHGNPVVCHTEGAVYSPHQADCPATVLLRLHPLESHPSPFRTTTQQQDVSVARRRAHHLQSAIRKHLRREQDLSHRAESFESLAEDRAARLEQQALQLSQAVESLRDREQRLSAILDTTVDAIITIDDRGICESFNRAAERIFGYSEEEIRGENIRLLMPPPYQDEHDSYIQAYLKTQQPKIIGVGRQVVGQRKDGSQFPLDLAVSEVLVGERRWFTGIIRDVSELRQAQQRVVQAERLAAVGQAMAGLAHESRNALQRIQVGIETARLNLELGNSVEEQLLSIERASDGLNALLEEIRNYAAPIRLELTDVRLADLWREAWQDLAKQREHRAAEIREIGDPQEVCCRVDRFRLVRLFRILLENSLAACRDPVVVTMATAYQDQGGTRQIEVTVRDNGPGLTEEQRQHVFEPFFTTKTRGTGLGMAIAQRIATAHGGRLSAGQAGVPGAEFSLTMPG